MRIVEVIERSRAKDGGRFDMPAAPNAQGHRKAFLVNRLALEDVVWTLNHLCPPSTRQGLAILLKELSECDHEVQARDALVRLAAWSIKGATMLDDRRASHAHDVC